MSTRIVDILQASDYEAEVRQAAELLQAGKVVVIPTETVYGAAAMLSQSPAVARLKGLRQDADNKPMTVHLADPSEAKSFVGSVNALGERMIKKLWPGPVALVFPVSDTDRKAVTARYGVEGAKLFDGQTITLRCPDHPVAIDLLGAVGAPVVVVRAGINSSQPALRADQVAAELDGKIDLILDAGPTRFNKPSTIVKVLENGYEIVRAGVYDRRIIERLLKTTILFVCSGNTCRSPMAEGIARKVLSEKLNVPEAELDDRGVSVISAGSFAMPGARATAQGVEALRSMGIDLTKHRSRPLSVELIHEADVIYTMGRSHAMAVMSLVPAAAQKVTTLAPGRDIEDPIGSDVNVYRELAGELRTLIDSRFSEKVVEQLLP